MALLEVEDLKVHFPIRGGVFGRTVDHVKAVDGVSLSIEQGKNIWSCWRIRFGQNNNRPSDYRFE